jgi:RNA polymerase sigma-70 factor (ECF subfamily)
MQSITSEDLNANKFCVWPREASYREDDLALVARIRAGDETAFLTVVDRYASRIFRTCYGILRNREDADEIAQEVFAKFYFSIQGFRGHCSLYAWTYRIAVNACYGLLREKRARRAYASDSLDDPLTLGLKALSDGGPTPDRAAMQREFLNKLMARIPEDDRWLLMSKEVEGYSIAELSEMTGLNVNTIKIRLFRVRQRLVEAATRLRSTGGKRSDNRR